MSETGSGSTSVKRACIQCGAEYSSDLQACPNCNTTLTVLAGEPQIGDIIGERYEIIDFIGDGGMGKVYKARHKLMKRTVAIKVLLPHLVSSAQALKRFQKEAEATSVLNHPNIMTVFDFGITENSGMPYLVMDYLEGISLGYILQDEARLPYDRAVKIFIQAAAALAHAHSKGIIHRDLKPSNIMLIDFDGQPDFLKLVDFGIAKLLIKSEGEAENLTQTGEIFGSPLFMSPEQCRGLELDGRSDMYSLGCVMYRTLTGRPVFFGQTMVECLYKQVHDAPLNFSTVCPELNLPDELEAIVLKCISKEPEQRYDSMNDLKTALEEFQAKSEGNVVVQVEDYPEKIYLIPPNSPHAIPTDKTTSAMGVVRNAPSSPPDSSSKEAKEENKQGEPAVSNGAAADTAAGKTAVNNADRTPVDVTGTVKMVSAVPTIIEPVSQLPAPVAKKPLWIGITALLAIIAGVAFIFLQKENRNETPLPAVQEDKNKPDTDNKETNSPSRFRRPKDTTQALEEAEQAFQSGDMAAAQRLLNQGLMLSKSKNGSDADKTLAMRIMLGEVYYERGMYREAMSALQQALLMAKKQPGNNAVSIANIKVDLAMACYINGDADSAANYLKQALPVLQKTSNPDDADIGDAYFVQAQVYRSQDDAQNARKYLQMALDSKNKASGKAAIGKAKIYNEFAWLDFLEGNMGSAERTATQTVALARKEGGDTSIHLADAYQELGLIYYKTNRPQQCEDVLKKALEIYSHVNDGNNRSAALVMSELGRLYMDLKRYADAEHMFSQALSIREVLIGTSSPESRRTRQWLQEAQRAQKSLK